MEPFALNLSPREKFVSTGKCFCSPAFCFLFLAAVYLPWLLARTVFDQLLSWVLGKKPVVQIGLGSPKTKFQSYRPINDTLPSIFVFGSIIMAKEPLTELKFAIFKKWHFERPNLRTDSKNPAKHPPKWWGRLLVHAFPFSGEYQAIF